MVVVSDTSPLRYLIEVEAVFVLPKLYGRVLTTLEVVRELRQEPFPDVVRKWAEGPPAWLAIEKPRELRFLDQLDDGEASALSLACERGCRLLLMDERAGSRVAQSCGIQTVGTLGILQEAGTEGLVDFHAAIKRLTKQTAFRHTEALISRVIAEFERNLRR